jgi:hypothetical protein
MGIHIIVEYRMLIPIEFEEALSITNSEVFKVQEAVWLIFADQLNKPIMRFKQVRQVHARGVSNLLVNESIVLSTSNPS